MDSECQRFADRKLCAHDVNFVIWIDLVVIGWISESQWQKALLLEVGLVLEVNADQQCLAG